ncbi:hypothetical protein JOF47_004241 [Paeniglutamicibacter kerguelensis]|uniref:Uncharacterized protein n=1 Tax=Paeniglutamicibacter kerguelensis TaxID=254788 RepID=A0ABS4XJR8_9MICC|nr:hypothetical protein [Paeniglutamicibacter kerguelensis]
MGALRQVLETETDAPPRRTAILAMVLSAERPGHPRGRAKIQESNIGEQP